MICGSCGRSAVYHDSKTGNTVCMGCGSVLEESAIVSEISFGETGGGAAMVQGSYVGADQSRARAPAGYRQKGGQESREQTIQNGRRRIQSLTHALGLSEHIADTGQRYFNLAVNMNFVQGRRTQYVVAACLYSACRMEKTSHMLIDFSDVLEINVFVLGSTYLKLIKELSLALPNVDPSLYISRFAALLEFGDETQKVAADAVRLVARMSRDWMHIGRRPAGVCGACLLLAARMNNFRRSITEVVQVVKIADVTLRKRLGEFKETASGGLTVDEFRTLWLDEVSDPPAFARSQKKEKLEREKLENARSVKEGTEDKEGRDALSDVANQMSGGDDEDGDDDSSPMKASQSPSLSSLGKRKQQDSDDDDEEDTEAETAAKEKQKISDKYLEHTSVEHGIANEVNTALGSTTGRALTTVLDTNESVRKIKAASMTNLFELNTSERLDDLNEAELEVFILTPEEVEAKSRLWMEFNKEYLQTLADKQTGPDGELRPVVKAKPRKRTKPRDSTNAQGESAADSTTQLFAKKRFSKKINYAAIEDLFAAKGQETSNGEVFGDASPYRARSESVTPGTPILVPAPTFSSSRQGTPAPRRSVSLAPGDAALSAALVRKKRVAVQEVEAEDWRAGLRNGEEAAEDEEIYDDQEL